MQLRAAESIQRNTGDHLVQKTITDPLPLYFFTDDAYGLVATQYPDLKVVRVLLSIHTRKILSKQYIPGGLSGKVTVCSRRFVEATGVITPARTEDKRNKMPLAVYTDTRHSDEVMLCIHGLENILGRSPFKIYYRTP